MLYYGWQNDWRIPYRKHEKPPKSLSWGAFLSSFLQGRGLRPRLVASRSLVKPSAKVVADYPRRDGDKEGLKNILHISSTPFPCRYGDGNVSSIAYFAAKKKRINRRKKRRKITASDKQLDRITASPLYFSPDLWHFT